MKKQHEPANMPQLPHEPANMPQLVKNHAKESSVSMKNMNQQTSLKLRNTIISASIAEEKTTEKTIKLSDTKFRSNSIHNMDTVCLC